MRDLAILILTMHQDDKSLFAAMRDGARGYLLKGADSTEVTAAIQAVARGEAVYGSDVAQRIIEFFSRREPLTARAFPELTDREHDILELLAQGSANREIASRLGSTSLPTRRSRARDGIKRVPRSPDFCDLRENREHREEWG